MNKMKIVSNGDDTQKNYKYAEVKLNFRLFRKNTQIWWRIIR